MIGNANQHSEPLPFESYPHQGRELLGRVGGGNCRHEYGLKFMQITKQTKCAYCGMNLTVTYENWLTMALDHVVPDKVCRNWGLPEQWREDCTNKVLCCRSCNEFDNRYQPKNSQRPSTLEDFYRLRDAIFIERHTNILKAHKRERAFFDQKLWM